MSDEIQEKISEKIKLFDLSSLLKLLESLGHSRKEIYFESNPNAMSHSSLCHAIAFSEESPKVTITLNMGLLSASSPIPTLFQKYMENEEIDSSRFISFLSFFNHHLLDTFVHMTLPQKEEAFFSNWKQTQSQYLSLLGFESISTLWFLMRICFPDLVVEVIKNPQVVRLHMSSLVLGRDSLGPHSYLGKRFNQTLSSFKVIFTTEEELSEFGAPWPIEINRRLADLVFPALKKTDLHFSILLVIKHKYNSMALGPKAYLGFDRLGKSPQPFQLLLFYGLIKDFKRNSYLASERR